MVTIADGARFVVPDSSHIDGVCVGLTNFETTEEQWLKAATGNPDRSLIRLERINKLINQMLTEHNKPRYILFPECSLPRRWAIRIAARLAKDGISMIAGIEYYRVRNTPNKVRNDTLVSLATRWPGYRSNIVYLQPKLQPSHGEKKILKQYGKRQFDPGNYQLPLYMHGDYFFAVINCSDLTTPENRAMFQGDVDGMFVLEWNKDVNTFSFLVESAAHDVHTFVVQVNNRMYGDSRIRVPHKVEHKRDSVRVKGGVSDFYVLGDMDFRALRKFQRKTPSGSKGADFKPVPIGFRMSIERRRDS